MTPFKEAMVRMKEIRRIAKEHAREYARYAKEQDRLYAKAYKKAAKSFHKDTNEQLVTERHRRAASAYTRMSDSMREIADMAGLTPSNQSAMKNLGKIK